ncbi:MAG TPA: hypothetical protein VHJ82_09900, partial [Actinomycetota bacterium]|nr:hypothetical protein [Actinomycetota bacterium]
MRLLGGLSTDRPASRPKVVVVAAIVGLAVAWSFAPVATGRAEAAFPGRNGRIAWTVLQPPFTEFPESLLNQVVVDRDIFT